MATQDLSDPILGAPRVGLLIIAASFIGTVVALVAIFGGVNRGPADSVGNPIVTIATATEHVRT